MIRQPFSKFLSVCKFHYITHVTLLLSSWQSVQHLRLFFFFNYILLTIECEYLWVLLFETTCNCRLTHWISLIDCMQPEKLLKYKQIKASLMSLFLGTALYENIQKYTNQKRRNAYDFCWQTHTTTQKERLVTGRTGRTNECNKTTLKAFCSHFFPIFRLLCGIFFSFSLLFFCLHDFLVPF